MKHIIKWIFGIIGAWIALTIVFWLCLHYQMNYKKTTCDTSVSPDGKYTLALQAVGEPDWPFGAASGRLILMEGDKKLSQTDFELFDDGGSINSRCWEVTWYEDHVEVILSGDEQEDELVILYFDGTRDFQYPADAEDEKGEEKSRQEIGEKNDDEPQQEIAAKNGEALQPTVVTVDFSDEFQAIGGCAVILDAEKNTYTFYHEDKCKTRVSPDSTFKIISALIGLHHQVVTSEDSKMGYDGTRYPVEAWNADLSLAEAFQSSCIWYFRKVLDQVGQEKIQQELTELAYGNCVISEWGGSAVNPLPELNGFWLESSLLISPVEQVEILRNIVEGKTMYTESEVEILKSIMQIETGDSKKLYGKTGTGTDGTAWFVGFVEKEDGNEYFAVYLDDNVSNEINGAKAQEIARGIL